MIVVLIFSSNAYASDETITRGEVYRLISEAAELEVDHSLDNNFEWEYKYRIALVDEIINYGNSSYENQVTRLEASKYIIDYINYIIEDDIDNDFETVPTGESKFTDIYGEAPNFLLDEGILSGSEFKGEEFITREEFEKVLDKATEVAPRIADEEIRYSIIQDAREINIDIEDCTENTIKVEDFIIAIVDMKHNNKDDIIFKYTEEYRGFVEDNGNIRKEYIDTILEAYEITRDLYPEYFVGEREFTVTKIKMASKGLAVRFRTGVTIEDSLEANMQREEFNEETFSIAKEMIDTGYITHEMSQKEIAEQLNKWVIGKLRYDNSYKDESFNGYGALKSNKAVCLGYTALYNRMLTIFKIDAVGISGKAGKELHIWTEAELDGTKYYIDTTWNDSAKGHTKYFTDNENKFDRGRSWDKDHFEKYRYLIK